MGSMLIAMYVVVGLMGLALLYFMYKTIINIGAERKKEKEYKEYLNKSMEEDYFVDPETGRKFTLEEAEAGVDFGVQNEVRADHEIEKQFFDEHDREVAFVKNELLKTGYTALEGADMDEPVYLYGKKATSKLQGVFTKGSGRFMMVARVEFSFQRTRVREDKIVIACLTKHFMGHALIWETDVLAKLENMIDGSQKISPTGKYTVNVLGDSKKEVFAKGDVLDSMQGINEEIIDKVTEVLEQYGKCECEIVGETIYVKSTVPATRVELGRMLEIEAHLFALLEKYLIK